MFVCLIENHLDRMSRTSGIKTIIRMDEEEWKERGEPKSLDKRKVVADT